MILSHDKHFIFYHVPKTAGSAITVALAPYSIYKHIKPNIEKINWQADFHIDGSLHRRAKDNIQYLNYYKFAFVRHPFTRILSRWGKHRREIDFENYILDDGFASDLIWDQKQLLCDDQGQLLVNFVGKYEYLNDDWKLICNMIDIPFIPLPSINIGIQAQLSDCKNYYTPEMESIMLEVYEDEMKLFNYEW